MLGAISRLAKPQRGSLGFLASIFIHKNAKCRDTLFREKTRTRFQREKARKLAFRNVPSLRSSLLHRVYFIVMVVPLLFSIAVHLPSSSSPLI